LDRCRGLLELHCGSLLEVACFEQGVQLDDGQVADVDSFALQLAEHLLRARHDVLAGRLELFALGSEAGTGGAGAAVQFEQLLHLGIQSAHWAPATRAEVTPEVAEYAICAPVPSPLS